MHTMEVPTTRIRRSIRSYYFYVALLSFVVLISSPAGVLARLSSSRLSDHGNSRQRSLRELSTRVHQELLSMAPSSTGLNAAAHVPQATKRIHRLLMEGSMDEEGEFDFDARAFARKALQSGSDALFQEAKDDAVGFQEVRSDLSGARHRRLKLTAGQAQFYLFLVFIVVMAVGHIINTDNLPVFAGPQYVDGIKGSDFDLITPCNQIPLSKGETFGYLPILAGLFEDDLEDFSDASAWLLSFLGLDETLRNAGNIELNDNCNGAGEMCNLSSECCADASSNDLVSCALRGGGGEQRQCIKSNAAAAGTGFVWEPFCILWSEDKKANSIDTLSFKPHYPWPPVEFVPGLPSLLPFCLQEKGCKGCEYHRGFPVGDISIGPIPFKVTTKFDGIAVSWASPGKLAFDTDDYQPEIWDGFRNILLPQIDGMNFWMSLQFEVIPLPIWEWGKTICETDSSFLDSVKEGAQTAATNYFRLTLKMDLFLSVDTTGNDGDGNELANQMGENIAGKNEGSRGLRELEGTDPCVIVTATAEIAIPLLGTLKFGNIAGGYCTYPAENGNRCTPDGAFLNINQEFRIEGGVAGVLSTFLEGMAGDMDMEPQKAGNSLGVFMNDGDFEAVVFRLEAPVVSLFGVTMPGIGRPIIHFQYVKGSEIERRRASILRTRDSDGTWIPNCANMASEEICDNNNDAHWADFGDKADTQICKNILINPNNNGDKLMYYNRVVTAELKNPKRDSDNYLIRAPDDSTFQTPARYDFSNDPDANVVIVHMGLSDFGNIIIAVREISLSLIFSDGAEPSIDKAAKDAALMVYNNMDSMAKEIWQPPSGWHFPSLQAYLDHLPNDLNNISTEEIEAVSLWNSEVERASNDGLRAYIRIFCKIAVLFFIEISLGFIMMNYANDIDPNKWRAAAQFEVTLLGLQYSVSVSTVIDFDRRRHLHLEGHDYHRALASSGLEGADYDVHFDVGCAPGSFCESFVKFFEDVGEAIWNGLQRIGEFFVEDIKQIAQEAIAMIGEWGKAFVGAIEDFAIGVRDLFLNGAVGEVLNSERVKAFNEDTKKAVETWSDGKFTLDDITAVGELILGGVQIAVDFIVAGVTDIINAVGDFFKNAGKAISKCFNGARWDEARHSGWRDPGACESQCNPLGSAEEVKAKCWCRDELGCKVKTPQKRSCEKKKLGWDFWNGCKTRCGSWHDMPEKEFKNRVWRYPRFEGRRFDPACRQERMAKLAEVEKKHGKMTATGQIVDTNFQSNVNGLSNFSEESRRQRRLNGGSATEVNHVSFQGIQATSGGILLDNVKAKGHYDGSRLRADSAAMDTVQRDLTVSDIDFTSYANHGGGMARQLQSDDIRLQFQRSTADVLLEEQKLDDPEFLSRQPIIAPPHIELTGSGTLIDPVELSCTGSLANAWSMKLNGAEPQVMRRRRVKEVDHLGTFETVIEFPAEATIRQMIIEDATGITISPGGSSEGEEDVFGDARYLMGTKGVGAFMDTELPKAAHGSTGNISTRQKMIHRSNLFDEFVDTSSDIDPFDDISEGNINLNELDANGVTSSVMHDYDWEVDVVSAEPLCDKLQWIFAITATDRTGTSNRIDLHAYLLYGEPEADNFPSHIQTRCDTSSIEVDDMEYDYELHDLTGFEAFTPSLRVDHCPSPYLHLVKQEDTVTNPGTPCTADYKTVQRLWELNVHTHDSHLYCPIPNTTIFPLVQNFTLGGLVDEEGLPATPELNLRPVTYHLPNKPQAEVTTDVSDFFANDIPPHSECGLCSDSAGSYVVYNHTHDFVCNDHGNNTVSVRVVNSIGIEVTKTTTATVIDDKPPNVADSIEILLEDGSVRGKVGNNTWDNCEISSYYLFREPITGRLNASLDLPEYEYFPGFNHFGSDRAKWVARDWQDNPSRVAVTSFDVIPVNDPPYIYTTTGDKVPLTISASDVDDAGLNITAKHAKGGGPEVDGLPVGLSFDKVTCNEVEKGSRVAPGYFPWANTMAPNAFPKGSECSWVVTRSGMTEIGTYDITFSVTDGGGGTDTALMDSVVVPLFIHNAIISSGSDRITSNTFFAVCAVCVTILVVW